MIIFEIIKLILPILSIVGLLIKPIKSILAMVEKNNVAVGVLLRDRLMSHYDEYMARGTITTKQLDDFTRECEKYWSFGFNHFSNMLLEDIKNLHK